MTVLFDRFMAKHPAFAKYFKRKLTKYFGTGIFRNMFCCICASLALGMIGDVYGGLFCGTALVIADIVWIQAAVLSGFLRQWLFVPFAVLFYLLPYGISDIFGSGFMYTLNNIIYEISELSVKYIAGQAQIFGIDGFNAASGCAAVCFLLFLLGLFMRSAAKKSDYYCKLRLELMN